MAMRIVLRASVPSEVTIAIDAAIPLPLGWAGWRDGLTGGAPVLERFTTPEGWPLSLALTGRALHAFYLVLDRAVHATALLPDGADAAVIDAAQTALVGAGPEWDDAIVALADL